VWWARRRRARRACRRVQRTARRDGVPQAACSARPGARLAVPRAQRRGQRATSSPGVPPNCRRAHRCGERRSSWWGWTSAGCGSWAAAAARACAATRAPRRAAAAATTPRLRTAPLRSRAPARERAGWQPYRAAPRPRRVPPRSSAPRRVRQPVRGGVARDRRVKARSQARGGAHFMYAYDRRRPRTRQNSAGARQAAARHAPVCATR
jgi:hypothetical protein